MCCATASPSLRGRSEEKTSETIIQKIFDELPVHDSREILKKIRQIEIRTNRLVSETLRPVPQRLQGPGMNFDEVREYQPGMSPHDRLNVTARMNHPFVKKFVEERS